MGDGGSDGIGDTGRTGDSAGDTGRMENNICRAKSRIRELALCNSWDYFFTGTVAPGALGVDRYSLRDYRTRLGQFLQNFNRDYSCRVRYVIVPEQHKSGAWHIHGLFGGIPQTALVINEHGWLDWPRYRARFGYCSLAPIKDAVRVSAYITKYVSKSLHATEHEAGEHLYYASTGLSGRQRLGRMRVGDIFAEFETEWCGITWASEGRLFNLLRAYEDDPGDYAREAALRAFLTEQSGLNSARLVAQCRENTSLNTPAARPDKA